MLHAHVLLLLFLIAITLVHAATPSASLPVIVIGAGMAGAGAARRLAENNVPVIVLEARNRFGGRVFTDKSMGVPADLGASWIHGPQGNPLTTLQQQYNMKIYQTNDNALTRFRLDGSEFADAEYAPSDNNFKTFKANLQTTQQNRITAGQADVSLESLMQQADFARFSQEDIQYHIGSNIEFDYGAPAILMSGLYYNTDSRFEGKDVLFPDGYDAMVSGLLNTPSAITVRYNTIVTAVNYTQDVVLVYTNQGIYNASKVICTVPLGVLKANDVVFTPELPEAKRNAISKLKMGFTNKIFLVFPYTFWPNSQQYFGISTSNGQASRGLYNYWLNANNFTNNAHVLVTFGLGTAGATVDTLTDAEIRNQTMAVLAKMFKVTIPQPTKMLVTRWSNEQFSKGAYSYCATNAKPEDFDTLGAAVGSNLYFAGEHTSRMYRGTVHGALITGRNAADAIAGVKPAPSGGIVKPSSAHAIVTNASIILLLFAMMTLLWA